MARKWCKNVKLKRYDTYKGREKLINENLVKALKSPNFRGQKKAKIKFDIQLFKNMHEN